MDLGHLNQFCGFWYTGTGSVDGKTQDPSFHGNLGVPAAHVVRDRIFLFGG